MATNKITPSELAESFTKVKLGSEPFDWNKILSKPFTESEHLFALEKARAWTTCATGSQCAVIPRHSNGIPKDYQLFKLGSDFYSDLLITRPGQDPKQARATLAKIEKRSAFLLAQPNYVDAKAGIEVDKDGDLIPINLEVFQ